MDTGYYGTETEWLFLIYRLITRAALKREYCSTEEQDYLDQGMEEAIAHVHASAGVMVSIGKEMHHGCDELVNITERVHECLPMTISRGEFSYALLIFGTLKVSIYTIDHTLYCPTNRLLFFKYRCFKKYSYELSII